MRLLLAEDDQVIGAGLSQALSSAGTTVEWVRDGQEAVDAALCGGFDVVVLDVSLPRIDGIGVLKAIRSKASVSKTPVLLLTALTAVEHRVAGLDAGADDYVGKPFDLDELSARIRALARRGQTHATSVLTCGDVELDLGARLVRKAGDVVIMSAKELRLLTVLMQRANRVVARNEIEEQLYGWTEEVESNTVETTIYNIRKKLGKDLIQTMRGVGYLIRP